ncbi:MAG: hypothetical protein ACI9FJ_000170 [Alteromonadaceae bacterium]|jgi:hypothetical protein
MKKQWLLIAIRREVVLRSLRVELIVGTILTVINHADLLYKEGLDVNEMLKIVLTFCVPYLVSTYASVSTETNRIKNPNN